MARTLLDRTDAVRALAGVFRRRGFESGSLSVIQQETGIGRGSLYHFFPAGKEDMARAVLDEVRRWFDEEVFAPLRAASDSDDAIAAMSRAVSDYFVSRDSVCLFAAMTLGEERQTFAEDVRDYFAAWVDALDDALVRGGVAATIAHDHALDAIATIQGGLILTRAYGDEKMLPGIVERTDRRLRAALA